MSETLDTGASTAEEEGTSEGLSVADVTLELSEDGRIATVEVTPQTAVPDASIRLDFYRNGATTHVDTVPLGDLEIGQSVQRSIELPEISEGDTGILAQVFTGSTGADSQFTAVRNGPHGVVTAISFEGLAEAELRRARKLGRLSEDEFRAEVLELHSVPGTDPAAIQVTPLPDANHPSTAAADQVTVSGTITYHDRNGAKRPVRNALLEIVSSTGLLRYELGRTSATGTFNATVANFMAGDYRIKIITDNEVGIIHQGSVNDPYYVASGPYTWSPGNAYSGVNTDIANTTDTGRSFALLDALRTVGAHYQAIRRSDWQSKLLVTYPGTKSEAGGGVISIAGSSLICPGARCDEDAFDWTILAHESGHVVAKAGGFDSSPGGDHGICDSAWRIGTTKQDALRLAWSEGWASFYGLKALQAQGVPAGIPDYSPTVYYDGLSAPPDPPTALYFYDIETAGAGGTGAKACAPPGEDSELTVQRALWDLYDSRVDADSGETAAWGSMNDIITKLTAGAPTTFSAAYQTLSSGRSWADRKAGQTVLAAHGMGPRTVTVGSGSPPTFSWSPAGGSATHPNDSFDVQFVDPGSGQVIKSVTVAATTYTPTLEIWNQIVIGRTGVAVQVAGRQTEAPATGPYFSPPVDVSLTGNGGKIMVVGDSITNGHEGDYTWRYRLAKHFAANSLKVDFVGPYRGTFNMYAKDTSATYRDGNFDSEHFSLWGWHYADAKTKIRATVQAHMPDYLVVALGFNDIAWHGGADGTITSMKTFIAEARAANPKLKIFISNVVNRSELDGWSWLNPAISDYKAKLPGVIASLTTAQSPIYVVDINSVFNHASDAYDGLHPNGVGEYKIAKAFADAFSTRLSIGSAFGAIPPTVPDVTLTAPTWATAQVVPEGIELKWGRVYGASGYYIHTRDVTAGEPFHKLPYPIADDHWLSGGLFKDHTYEYRITAAYGSRESSASPIASGVANPQTPPQTQGVKVIPGQTSVEVTWQATPGATKYEVYAQDQTTGAWLPTVTATATSYTYTGLATDHRYNVAVSGVNAIGAGVPGGALPAHTGRGTPPVVSMTDAWQTGPAEARLTWNPSFGAVGYWIEYFDYAQVNPAWRRMPFPIDATTIDPSFNAGYLTSGPTNYGFRIVAANGGLEANASSHLRVRPQPLAADRLLTEKELAKFRKQVKEAGYLFRRLPDSAFGIPPLNAGDCQCLQGRRQ
ncbi:GDSL-type esterase/lipase family protein [Nonomuraea sp. NPDC046570]|uniref:GDSL-type esterase/lipase family protein n=1 Tax=Nonomuraea sp. NPDC046570 TaxID=3155255 RepID=UPI0033E14359